MRMADDTDEISESSTDDSAPTIATTPLSNWRHTVIQKILKKQTRPTNFLSKIMVKSIDIENEMR